MTYPVYVLQQGARIQIDNRRLQVRRQQEVLLSEPLSRVSELVLFGNVQITTQTVTALLNKSVPVVYLSYHGRYRGRTSGPFSPHVPLRRAQYAALGDEDILLAYAKGIVYAKLQHQQALLWRQNQKRNDPTIAAALARLRKNRDTVQARTRLSSLRGHEGAAAAAYFQGYRRLFDPVWRFEARRRRPPPDPINVLLSFGYTLLAQAAFSACLTAGLDPYAGFYHTYEYNRPGMALDLMEEFRPVIDGLVLWVVHSGQISPAHFRPGAAGEYPIVMSDEGKKRFLAAYEQRMQRGHYHEARKQTLTLRQCLIEQGRQIARRLLEQQHGYHGLGFR